MSHKKIHVYLLRASVLLLPLAAALQLPNTLAANPEVDIAVQAILWAGWMCACISVLAPHPVGVTYLRLFSIALLAVLAWTFPQESNPIAVAIVLLFVGLSFANETATWCINGLSYPNERRFTLRPPSALLVGPLFLAGLAIIAIPGSILYFYANDNIVATILTAVIGIPIMAVLFRALHSLARRWIVFVPAGLVVHDPMSLADPVLFMRNVIDRFGPAPRDTDALDLTQNALGHSIELDLYEKVPMVLVLPGGRTEAGSSARLMISPTNPAEVMAEARSRNIPTN